MSQLPSSQPVRNTGTSHIISVGFACLSCVFFLIGSILICNLWFGVSTIGSSGGVLIRTDANDEGNSIATILILLAMLFLFWLFGTIALLIARRWVASALILPVTIILFIGIYLFSIFVAYRVPGGPEVAFVLLFVLLNVLLFGVVWRLLIQPSYRLTHEVP